MEASLASARASSERVLRAAGDASLFKAVKTQFLPAIFFRSFGSCQIFLLTLQYVCWIGQLHARRMHGSSAMQTLFLYPPIVKAAVRLFC